jgi:hypothetical protein
MAFEILDPLPPFSSLSPARRGLYAVLAMGALAAVLWACDTVAHAPIPPAPETIAKIRQR